MRRAKLEIIKEEIFSFFDAHPQKVFTFKQLNELFLNQKEIWKLPESQRLRSFINFLIQQKRLYEQPFNFNFCPTTLFFWGQVSMYEVAMSLRPAAYLSHLSAMHVHRLIDELKPKIIYVNDEQSTKPTKSQELEQIRIDAAFKRGARRSNNKVVIDDQVFYLLSGKNTNRLGVIEKTIPSTQIPVRVTCLERTMIDGVVRTLYSGGVQGVLQAYQQASDRLDVEYLVHLLQQLDYVYPYHQAIGFYLERSNKYDHNTLEHLKRIPQKFDFYLDYQMEDIKFSKEWRLYYPSYLD